MGDEANVAMEDARRTSGGSFDRRCENMTPGQKGAATGAALGSGIGMVAGGSFGQVVGAGLIGGAAGYITGSAIGNR